MEAVTEMTIAGGRLIYRLTEENNDMSVKSYGISISTTLFGAEETEAVKDISTEKSFVETLMSVLADNIVLPSTLKEIVGDYVAAKYTA